MARAILRREFDNRSKAALRLGEPPLSADDEDVLLERVLATAFSAAPGLDALLRRSDVTDVFVNGCDDVRLVTIDGETELGRADRPHRRRADRDDPDLGPTGRAHGTRVHAVAAVAGSAAARWIDGWPRRRG